jgi:hypothetical protein
MKYSRLHYFAHGKGGKGAAAAAARGVPHPIVMGYSWLLCVLRFSRQLSTIKKKERDKE